MRLLVSVAWMFTLGVGAAIPPVAAQEATVERLSDKDLPGHDYRTLKEVPLSACERACLGEEDCAAYTYDERHRWCFLKHTAGSPIPFARATSGVVRRTQRPVLADGYEVLYGADLPGGDYDRMDGISQNECHQRCAQSTRCLAFTYNETYAACFLKDEVASPVPYQSATSGIYRGIARSDATTPPAAAPTTEVEPGVEIVGTGTGFFVGTDGTVVTNAHVVEDCDGVATLEHGLAFTLAVDRTRDLAVLRFASPPGLVPAHISPRRLRLGDDITALGYPAGSSGLTATTGNVAALSTPMGSHLFQISAPIQPGNSGGPVIDRNGMVVGVVVARARDIEFLEQHGALPQNVNFAISADALLSLLSEQEVRLADDTGENLPDGASNADAIERVAGATVQLACFNISAARLR